MTPKERALLLAIAEHLYRASYDLHLREMCSQVRNEDERRPDEDRMPAMSREAYNERLSQR